MTNYVLLLLSIAIVCASSKTIRSVPSNNNSGNDVSTHDRGHILTLPLLTYHTLKQRRMLQMGLDEDGMESYLESLPTKQYSNSTRRTSIEVGGIYQGYGTHYVDLWVGTPPQRQTVIVDTGSSVTAFPCSACSDCGKDYHASPFFVEADSVSFHKMKCENCKDNGSCNYKNTDDEICKIGVSYQEGSSWSAYQSEDLTYIGGPHDHALDTQPFGPESGKHLGASIVDEDPADAASFRFPLRFGCQTSITGLFKTQLADGIMGMAIQTGSFWQQMYKEDIIDRQKFSLCFSRRTKSDKSGTPAGAVTMGGTDTNLHKSPMVFAHGFVGRSTMHSIKIRKIYFMKSGQYDVSEAATNNTVEIDSSVDDLNHGGVILDSGTTDTYLHKSIATAFKDAFMTIVGVPYSTSGMKLSDDQVRLLPSIIVQLDAASGSEQFFDPSHPDATPGLAVKLDPSNPNDVLVVVTPNHYFDFDSKYNLYKPRVYVTEWGGSVLGANFMAGHDILFDIPDNNRIGFAASDCNYINLINGTHASSKDIADITTR